ncbi:MAG: hypothetical protein WDN76_05315 [Alphaproteobacteria bacterium]
MIDKAAIVTERHAPRHAERALILGWNRRGPAVASELSCYMTDNSVHHNRRRYAGLCRSDRQALAGKQECAA